MKRLSSFLLVLFLAACAPAATGTPAPVQPTVAAPLTAETVRNAQVFLTTLTNDVAIPYQLKDGRFQKGTDPSGASYADIKLLDQMAFGDLNGDGVGDAVALIAENYGGTGVFVSLLAFVNEDGAPVQKAALGIDDRPVIGSLAFENNGEVTLEATLHTAQDPMCCPSQGTRQQFRLYGSRWVRLAYASQTPSGQWRSITVTAPASASPSEGRVEITGTVTIAPFENNLSWHLVDEKGNELAAGPVPVTAMDMGAPGTFKVTVPLDHVKAGSLAWIEIRDLSAADGSLLAMDSVVVE